MSALRDEEFINESWQKKKKKEEKVLQFPSNLEEDNLIMQKGFSGHVPKNLFEDFEMPPSSADCGLWGGFFVLFFSLPCLIYTQHLKQTRGGGQARRHLN